MFFLVAIKTPTLVIKKPNTSNKFNVSFKNTQAIAAEVAGTKKNSVTVLLAELILIKYIKIENAPKETSIIWWDIAKTNLIEKLI